MTNDTAHDPQRVWDLARKIQTAMLANWDGRHPHARPMHAHVDQDEHAFYFLADRTNHKTEDLAKYPTVCLAFSDIGDNKYLSVTGEATVSSDRAKIRELWNPWAKAWWQSPDDPNICVLKVVPVEAEYWDTPGKVVSTIKMAVATVTGSRPVIGENKKVAM